MAAGGARFTLDTAYLQKVRSENARLKAFIALAGSKDLVRIRPRPDLPLAGFTVGVKDLFDTADFPTSYGSAIYRNYRPAMDAAIVSALKEAGAFITGKTTTTEFATWPPTKTRNPRSAERTPGGSSAGSAASVAAGLVDLAVGTQTKGSVIRPASYCGVVGFKPSFNRLSRAGVKMLAESLDTVGLFATCVADVELAYRTIARDPPPAPKALPQIAFCRTPQWDHVEAGVRAALLDGVEHLRQSGLKVDEIDMPKGFELLPEKAGIVHDYEMARSLLPEIQASRELIDPSLAEALDRSSRIAGEAYAEAQEFLSDMRLRVSPIFIKYGAVLCAATADEPPELSQQSTGSPIMNISWTALHLPCVTLPALRSEGGLPVGLQLVGGLYRDAELLRVAEMLEEQFPPFGICPCA